MRPRVLLHYEIVEKLGQGGMGEVYRARDRNLGRDVALKILPPELAKDPARRRRFEQEARAVAALNHPGIVTVHSIDEAEGIRFLTMECVEGCTLQERIPPGGMELDALLEVALPLTDAVAAAHGRGITHRDLKPANVMCGNDGRVKVLDFGLAKLVAGEADAATIPGGADSGTAEGTLLGTVAYMSPEQAEGLPVDARSDVFSLGVVLYEMATGVRPFRGKTNISTVSAILKDEPAPVTELRPASPPELDVLIRRCLRKRPEDRFASARELHDALQRVPRATAQDAAAANANASAASLAVIPFENMSSDPENEYFSDGLTEELLNVLARNPALRVTGRTSSFAFKGTREDARTIGGKLGVGAILQGSVRKSGQRVRIAAQLVDAADGFPRWSETFDRVLEDVFDLQDEIAGAVAKALNVALLGRPVRARTVDPESYALALRARQQMTQLSPSSMSAAVDLYSEAIARDEDNAQAWAGLARTLLGRAAWGHETGKATLRRAKEAVRRALEIDDGIADAHEAAGLIAYVFESRWSDAEASLRRAYELAPANSQFVWGYAQLLFLRGHREESRRLFDLAVEVDPLSAETHMMRARFLWNVGDVEEAERGVRRAMELSPGITGAPGLLAFVLRDKGRLDEAFEAIEAESVSGYRHCTRSILLAAKGDMEASAKELEALIALGEDWAFQIAAAHAARGEKDDAFRWLDRAVETHDAGLPGIPVSSLLRDLHDDPRWGALLERIGL